jgi:regulator of sigma E protease
MNILLCYFLPVILVLGVLIFFHELGHFLIAKLFNVKVLKFSLGLGHKLAGKRIGETEYLISTVPLGGYVKMLGEKDDESEFLTPGDEERAFQNQHVLKRIAIVAAGPVFNLVLAILLFSGFFLISEMHVMIPEIGQVKEDSPADKAGLMKGDVIVSIQGKKIEGWFDIEETVHDKAGVPLDITVKRGEKFLTLSVVPEEAKQEIYGQEIKFALTGIVSSGKFEKMEFGPWEAIRKATIETCKWVKRISTVIVGLFQGRHSIRTLGGPIMIGHVTGQAAQERPSLLVPLTAVISINLAIINLFPIPILDGGVIIFLLIELLVGKPIGLKKRNLAQRVGLFMIIFLMAVVFYNDVTRLIFK